MPYLIEGVAPVTPALGVALSPSRPSDSSLRPIESTFGARSGRSSGLDDLIQRQRLHVELLVGERLQTVGPDQMRVFGAQKP